MSRRSRKPTRQQRKQRRNAWIYCQGQVTEREYFRLLVSRYPFRDVVVNGPRNTSRDPESTVKQALKEYARLETNGAVTPKRVFVVVDRDESLASNIQRATSSCSRFNASHVGECVVDLVVSDPCFEVFLYGYLGRTFPTGASEREIYRTLALSQIVAGEGDKFKKHLHQNFDPLKNLDRCRKVVAELGFGEISESGAGTSVVKMLDELISNYYQA